MTHFIFKKNKNNLQMIKKVNIFGKNSKIFPTYIIGGILSVSKI